MPRGIRDEGRMARQGLIIRRVLRRARRKGWDDAKSAAVLQASLLPSRVKYGVVGPCFYCGKDEADSVDHLQAIAKGGTDDRTNVVSACWPCNYLKDTTELEWFLWLHPFGSDRLRESAYFAALDGYDRPRRAIAGEPQMAEIPDDDETERVFYTEEEWKRMVEAIHTLDRALNPKAA